MKLRRRCLKAVAILLLAGTVAAQEADLVQFTGAPSPAAVPFPMRGAVKCIGAGDPTPANNDMPPWCPAGTQTSVANRIQTAKWNTTDPNTTGDMTWFHNFQVDSATFAGTWWGSFMLNIPGKGMWQGWYWGESYASGKWQLRLIGVGFGAFNLYTLMAEATVADPTKPPVISGRYLKARN